METGLDSEMLSGHYARSWSDRPPEGGEEDERVDPGWGSGYFPPSIGTRHGPTYFGRLEGVCRSHPLVDGLR